MSLAAAAAMNGGEANDARQTKDLAGKDTMRKRYDAKDMAGKCLRQKIWISLSARHSRQNLSRY